MKFLEALKEKAKAAGEKLKEKIEFKVEEVKEKIRKNTRFNELVKHANQLSRDSHISSWACICDKCEEERKNAIETSKDENGRYINKELEARRQAIVEEFAKAREEIKNEDTKRHTEANAGEDKRSV